ncbi:hypothetical protein SK854_38000 [Lentzea sp. BCCO 10_0061]|uniref:Uncharacterized protein n=1 Tax=Lentzea sokolovensis TaxID=3095429 RepID=A0ABU4V829_9PSEU|nr:hypothetical protein [Lentzea sp. BCCO 10_0061]MDX8147958.1 hypothetical protein [Lentzea sp. BCCO 10_0061]
MNSALAAALDSQSDDSERLLAALADHGVFVPVQASGSVLFATGADGGPAIPGFVSEACCADQLPQAAGAVHCDVLRLLDIAKQTGVDMLSLHSFGGWARVPVPLLRRAMRERGRDAAGEWLQLRPSTHALAIALRQALVRRIAEFPAIRTVWVSNARWRDTGMEHLMLHFAVDEPIPSPSVKRLMDVLLTEEVEIGEEDPQLGTLALNTKTHAGNLAELETLGLDPVRAPRPKRWWRRS